jgi:Leucine-rich repeat (LRR) protein
MRSGAKLITVDSDMEDDSVETGCLEEDAEQGQGQELELDDSLLNMTANSRNTVKKAYIKMVDDPEDPPVFPSPILQRERKVEKSVPPPPPLSPSTKESSFEASWPSEGPAPAPTPTKKSNNNRLCCWISLIGIVILLAVAIPLAVIFVNHSSNRSMSTLNSNISKNPPGQGGGKGNKGGNNTSNSSGTNNATNNGGNSGSPNTPTASPTAQGSQLLRVAQSVTSDQLLSDPTTPQAMALKWLQQYERKYDYKNSDALRLQRYVLSVLGFHFYPYADPPKFGHPLIDECQWMGVLCGSDNTTKLHVSQTNTTVVDVNVTILPFNLTTGTMMASNTTFTDGLVTKLIWAEQGLNGTIPTEIALLKSLQYLDLGENMLTGTLPEELFKLTALEHLYLQENMLQGTLSDSFGKLSLLASFYGGNNAFNGVIPQSLGSPATGATRVRPLRKYSCPRCCQLKELDLANTVHGFFSDWSSPEYLSLHRNYLTGSIPTNMNLRNLVYMDLSFNALTGTIPIDWMTGKDAVSRLHTLYLDHNKLSGPLSTLIPALGNGRLEQLFLNDNSFSGTFPGSYQYRDNLQQLEM